MIAVDTNVLVYSVDSLLVAACIDAEVTTLYSEGLSDGTTYDSVMVINPFA